MITKNGTPEVKKKRKYVRKNKEQKEHNDEYVKGWLDGFRSSSDMSMFAENLSDKIKSYQTQVGIRQ